MPDSEDESDEQVHKGMAGATVQAAAVEEVGASAEAKAVAPPSVVIPWVLKELLECVETIRKDRLTRDVHYEAHAARLLLCWQEHSDQFPITFSQELLHFILSLGGKEGLEYFPNFPYEAQDNVNMFAQFLVEIFVGSSPYHVALLGKELWPEVSERLFKKDSTIWVESAEGVISRERMECLLDCLMTWSNFKIPYSSTRNERFFDSYVPSDSSVRNALAFRKAVSQAKEGLKNIKLHKERAAAKASLKAAPWEIDSSSIADVEGTTL